MICGQVLSGRKTKWRKLTASQQHRLVEQWPAANGGGRSDSGILQHVSTGNDICQGVGGDAN